MADPGFDPDAYTKPFQLTKALHRDVYSAVDLTNPQLSAENKTVLITGGGGTLGKAVAKAWAAAHVYQVVLVGRRSGPLEQAEAEIRSINPAVKTSIETADTRNEAEVKALFEKLAKQEIKVDAVVDAAGAINTAVTGTLEPSMWFNDFEANVKAPYLLSHYMMATYGDQQGTIIVMASNAAALVVPGMSSYACSKLAVTRVLEFLQIEHPKMRFFALSPGNVASPLTNPGFLPFAKDTGALAGGWTLFLATQRADYMKGGFLNVNWDVDEMESHREVIEKEGLLKLGFIKAQLGPSGHPF
ncbi:NAD(P)-binding protein [Lentithecium fluviatile CBS 122367]|uniref:NAD(P)-binding protein n=1 Tax=Lentithecium fluviatile CBS 122367 TaxID=1168545 RepID=A0A6G1IIG4_9PLEO|nr:NAD(P)-binding protein [Lentithecium fluviatile CBS 122367]